MTDEQILNFEAEGGALAPVADERCPTCKSKDPQHHPLHGDCPDSFHSPVVENSWGWESMDKDSTPVADDKKYPPEIQKAIDEGATIWPSAEATLEVADGGERAGSLADDIEPRTTSIDHPVADGGEGRDPACNDPDCSYRSEIQTGYYARGYNLAELAALRERLEEEKHNYEIAYAAQFDAYQKLDKAVAGLREIAEGTGAFAATDAEAILAEIEGHSK